MQNNITVIFVALMMIGCTHTTDSGVRFLPEQYVSNVLQDSIYYYGYNQGCESALAQRGISSADFKKDSTLDGSNSRFNTGWDDGMKACATGEMKVVDGINANNLSI
ncbi:hypothetical protein SKA34_10008 [Photobacterium sp. SKA34]|uniref:hypothetical protein n=1 Tax=Photobacterium sp. SKA34 TaxID=121723 RepID=UPI00006B6926|nr:hypothetical protein [Photobacterium sp. SKA34]EAR54668.1 hypothetical protein SKA34_10008 [Photobacterium sp. SKA34]